MATTLHIAKANVNFQLPEGHTDLRLDSQQQLDDFAGRRPCPGCSRNQAYYCGECICALTPTPTVQLPMDALFLMHYAEKVSKGTGVQAALLAPQHVRVHRLRRGNEYAIQVYPIGEAGAQAAAEGVADGAVDGEGGVDPPLQFDPQTDVVLFPGPGAKTAAELKAEGKTPRRVIIIDSSWQKGNGVMMSKLLSALPRMKLTTSRSAYWRYRPKGKGGVPAEAEGCSSIEALWFVCKEMHASEHSEDETCHCYDNLLWYFDHNYRRVLQRHVEKSEAARGEKRKSDAVRQAGGTDGRGAVADAKAEAERAIA